MAVCGTLKTRHGTSRFASPVLHSRGTWNLSKASIQQAQAAEHKHNKPNTIGRWPWNLGLARAISLWIPHAPAELGAVDARTHKLSPQDGAWSLNLTEYQKSNKVDARPAELPKPECTPDIGGHCRLGRCLSVRILSAHSHSENPPSELGELEHVCESYTPTTRTRVDFNTLPRGPSQ